MDFRRFFAVVFLLTALLVVKAADAQTLTGGWEMELRGARNWPSAQMDLKIEEWRDFWSFSVDLFELDDFDLKAIGEGPLNFQMARDAGVIEFVGEWDGRRWAEGEFTFTASEPFLESLRGLRIRNLGEEEMLQAVVFDMRQDWVDGLAERGFTHLRYDDLVAMSIHGADLEFIEAMEELGYERLSPDELVAMRIHGVTPGYINALAELGIQRVDGDELVAMKIHGVSIRFIEQIQELGYYDVDVDDLVACRIHGVSIGFIERVLEDEPGLVDLDEIVGMKIHNRYGRYHERP